MSAQNDLTYDYINNMIRQMLYKASNETIREEYGTALRYLKIAIQHLKPSDRTKLTAEIQQIEQFQTILNTANAFPGKIQLWGETDKIRQRIHSQQGQKLYDQIQEKLIAILIQEKYFEQGDKFEFYDPSNGRPSP